MLHAIHSYTLPPPHLYKLKALILLQIELTCAGCFGIFGVRLHKLSFVHDMFGLNWMDTMHVDWGVSVKCTYDNEVSGDTPRNPATAR